MLNGPGTMTRGSKFAPLPIGMFHGEFTAKGHVRASRVPADCTGVLGGCVKTGGFVVVVGAGAVVVVVTTGRVVVVVRLAVVVVVRRHAAWVCAVCAVGWAVFVAGTLQ